MKRIILASTSPRRKELFQKLNIPFECVGSSYEEDMTQDLPPEDLVKELALGKALDVAEKYPDATVVGADTVVVFNGKVQGKPHTPEKASEVLRLYSGECVLVVTGVAIISVEGARTKSCVSQVCFKTLSEQRIQEYVATGEPLDKAGAFGIQGKGAELIDRTEGDFDNIIGLPIDDLREMLAL